MQIPLWPLVAEMNHPGWRGARFPDHLLKVDFEPPIAARS